jgi:hypothetical protein
VGEERREQLCGGGRWLGRLGGLLEASSGCGGLECWFSSELGRAWSEGIETEASSWWWAAGNERWRPMTDRAGFSRSVVRFFPVRTFSRKFLRELFVEVGGNWKRKSSIPTEIRGIGARNFEAM